MEGGRSQKASDYHVAAAAVVGRVVLVGDETVDKYSRGRGGQGSIQGRAWTLLRIEQEI